MITGDIVKAAFFSMLILVVLSILPQVAMSAGVTAGTKGSYEFKNK